MDWVWIAILSWTGISLPLALVVGSYLRGCDQRGARRHAVPDGSGAPPVTAQPTTPTGAAGPAPRRHRSARGPSLPLARSVHACGPAPRRSEEPAAGDVEPPRRPGQTPAAEDAEPGKPNVPAATRRRTPLHRHL